MKKMSAMAPYRMEYSERMMPPLAATSKEETSAPVVPIYLMVGGSRF
jgi:hypothetical protein